MAKLKTLNQINKDYCVRVLGEIHRLGLLNDVACYVAANGVICATDSDSTRQEVLSSYHVAYWDEELKLIPAHASSRDKVWQALDTAWSKFEAGKKQGRLYPL